MSYCPQCAESNRALAAKDAEIARLQEALRHLAHNAKKSGANMGLALDVAYALLPRKEPS